MAQCEPLHYRAVFLRMDADTNAKVEEQYQIAMKDALSGPSPFTNVCRPVSGGLAATKWNPGREHGWHLDNHCRRAASHAALVWADANSLKPDDRAYTAKNSFGLSTAPGPLRTLAHIALMHSLKLPVMSLTQLISDVQAAGSAITLI